MRMVLGAALAAVALAVFHHRVGAQYAFAVWAGTGFISHVQTPFAWSSRCNGRCTLSSDYRQGFKVHRR
jgi:hypothetical protein